MATPEPKPKQATLLSHAQLEKMRKALAAPRTTLEALALYGVEAELWLRNRNLLSFDELRIPTNAVGEATSYHPSTEEEIELIANPELEN